MGIVGIDHWVMVAGDLDRTLAFYARLAGILYSLLSYAIIGGLVGGLIGLYILFQIREKYS